MSRQCGESTMLSKKPYRYKIHSAKACWRSLGTKATIQYPPSIYRAPTSRPLKATPIRYVPITHTLPHRGIGHTYLVCVPHDLVSIRRIHRRDEDAICGDPLELKTEYPSRTINRPCCVCEYLLSRTSIYGPLRNVGVSLTRTLS